MGNWSTPRTGLRHCIRQSGLALLLSVNGKKSDQSNLVAFPLNTPTVTYQALLKFIDTLDARGRYFDPIVKMSRVRKMVQDSQAAALAGKIDNAIKALQTNKAVYDTLAPDATDIDIFMSKLIRKLTLYNQLHDVLASDIVK